MNFCVNCGAKFPNPEVKFCTACGQARATANATESGQQRPEVTGPVAQAGTNPDQGPGSGSTSTSKPKSTCEPIDSRAKAALVIVVLVALTAAGLALVSTSLTGETAKPSSTPTTVSLPTTGPTFEAPADDSLPSTIACEAWLPRNSSLSKGASGPEVSALQWALASLQYETQNGSGALLPVTGTFDGVTADAVRRFQENHALPATGVVDQATWTKLNGQLQTWGTNPPCPPSSEVDRMSR